MRECYRRVLVLAVLTTLAAVTTATAADQPQWGERNSRNMVSEETNLPATFDPETGKNVRWSFPLGTESNSTPVVADGKVIVGTNNGQRLDPRHDGNRGVLLCLDEKTGKLLWRLFVPRLEDPKLMDWRIGGICSSATVEGDRVYVVCCRDEVICLDLNGQADGNDGPFRDEGRLMAPADMPPVEITDTDADVVWRYDIVGELGANPHDNPQASILIDGQYLYLNTSNGLDRIHTRIPAPDTPSLIVLDKETGRLVAREDERISPRIFHCAWSSPALGTVNGQRRIIYGGADGICYGFTPVAADLPVGPVKTLDCVWRFDCDPTAPKENVHRYLRNRRVSPSTITGMPVFHNNRIYVTCGGDIWWGKRQAWLKCIDATGTGDVTDTALIWSAPLEDHCCATPAIHDGLVFVSDYGRTIHCLDAETGETYWTQQTRSSNLGSPLVADGKVYVGTKGRNLWVFAAEKEKKVLATIDLDSPIVASPMAANGTLYIATFETLYAVGKPASQ